MTYILIIWMNGYAPITAVAFDTHKACMAAGAVVSEKRGGRMEFVCMPKGDPQ